MIQESGQSERCRVVLLNPPTAVPSSSILLNLAYLSSALKEVGHEPLVLDATAPCNRLNEQDIEQRIRAFDPHMIGVTLTIDYIPATYDYLGRLRRLGIPIVAGGPHANCLPEEVLRHGVDIVSIGEGERTIVELAEHFVGDKPLQDIAGLCYRDDEGRVVRTAKRELIDDLDTIPLPDHESFPIANYTGSDDPNSNPMFWSVFTSRGCPFNCTFCSSHNVFGRTYRARSPENVADEIEHLVRDLGASFFAFQDDEAFINEERIVRFCELIAEKGLDVRFSARLRIDSLSASMLTTMARSGFRRVGFGVESWNDETLKRINKKYTVARINESLRIIADTQFPTVYFGHIIGFPWETPGHLRAGRDEIAKMPRSITYFSSVGTPIPYPGTKLYDDYHEEYGFTDWWLDPKRNSPQAQPVDTGPFFMSYAYLVGALYMDDRFWRYSAEVERAIRDYCWAVFRDSMRRAMSWPEYAFVYYLSRASYAMWRVSPSVERVLFAPLKAIGRWLGMPDKAAYHKR